MSENQGIKLNLKALRKDAEINDSVESSENLVKKQEDISGSQAIVQQEEATISTLGDTEVKTSISDINKMQDQENTFSEGENTHVPIPKVAKISIGDIKRSQNIEKVEVEDKEEIPNPGTESALTQSDSIVDTSPENAEKAGTTSTVGKNINISSDQDKKTDMSEVFKEVVLSDEEQEEIVNKTLNDDEETKQKKGFFGFLKKKSSNEKEGEEEGNMREAEEVHFTNYTSVFEEQSQNLLKRIQNFKYTPKTRVGLLLTLISFTIMIISGLMIFFPEKHSVSIYKASILEIIGKTPIEIDNEIVFIPEEIDSPELTEENLIIEEEVISVISESEKAIIQKEEEKEKIKVYILDKYKSR